MYDYNEFFKKWPVNQHDDSARHSAVAALCRGNVLDIGCGAGMLADYYFGPYFGVDISSEAIKNAKEIRRADAQFFVADPTKGELPIYDKFDTIVMSEFLEHLENEGAVFANVLSRIKPDGRLIITVPNFDRIPCDEHERIFTIPELRKKLKPFGEVKFYNWAGAFHQILCTVDFGQKNAEDLSLVMIVKNEEKGLEKAVLSVIEFVDNIVICVDDSTTDSTQGIALMYADTFKTFKFADDFSAARNFAHEGVKTKWILFLDGHEYFDKTELLESYLKSENDGLLIPIQLESGFTFHNPRIYRNGIQFEGKVHEKQACKTTELCPRLLIRHDRVGSASKETILARDRQRDDMVPRIMGDELKKNPKNIRALFHLGLYYQTKGHFKKALFCYSRYLKFSKNSQERWFVLFHRTLCLLSSGHNFRAFWAASRAEWELPNRWEISKLKGLILMFKKEYGKALEYFVKSFNLYSGPALYRPWGRNDADSWNLIGECFFNLGDFYKAYTAFDRGAELASEPELKKFLEKRAKLMADIFKSQNQKAP
jgi:glycosyltransferase involved in cell wall biosynthesis/ubiquinone/menaquinone biosynthesis C-methylase UbiE